MLDVQGILEQDVLEWSQERRDSQVLGIQEHAQEQALVEVHMEELQEGILQEDKVMGIQAQGQDSLELEQILVQACQA